MSNDPMMDEWNRMRRALQEATALLGRWALREPVTVVPPGFSDVGTDTRDFLKAYRAPAQPTTSPGAGEETP